MKRYFSIALVPVFAVLAAFAVACGGGGSADLPTLATQAAGTSPQTNVTVEAKALKFNTKTIVVPAKTNITITLDNQDGGTLHNIAVYRAKDAKEIIHRGELFQGRESKSETWESPEAGVYYFRCDAHPDMNGAFIAK
jgi:plastocyanin